MFGIRINCYIDKTFTCEKCKRPFAPGEAVYRDWRRICSGHSYVRSFFWSCFVCLGPKRLGNWIQTQCRGCSRPMYQARWRFHRVSRCSKACALKQQTRRQKQRRQARRIPLLCKVCGQKFEARRSHAKTCSTRCRVALYRSGQLRVVSTDASPW